MCRAAMKGDQVTVWSKAVACTGVAGLLLALPGVAQAKTKSVSIGLPEKTATTFQTKFGADVNDFFAHRVSIHVGDKVRFVPAGFHTVDIPAKGGAPLPLFAPTGAKVSGSSDAAGQPFWFNGQDEFAFNPALASGSFSKTVTYTGSKRVISGVAFGPVKPMVVKFPKKGTVKYYCNVHPGMTGIVKVRPQSKAIPSKKADKRALKRQIARDRKTAKTLATTKTPAATLDVGVAGPHGEEFYGFVPNAVTVPVGTTLLFRMSQGSRDVHTASTGPGNPDDPNQQNTYLGQLAASFADPTKPLDPRVLYQSEPPGAAPATLTPLLPRNGFWNAGVMDTATGTPSPESNSVSFGAPGKYEFYCLIHTFMHATVTVQ